MEQAKPQPNVDELIDAAMEEAPQALLVMPDVPMGRTDELLAAIQGLALRAVLDARLEQILKHGHDAAWDQMLPIGYLPRAAYSMIQAAIDSIDATEERRNLPIARKRLARGAALCLAAIDRLDSVKEGDAAC